MIPGSVTTGVSNLKTDAAKQICRHNDEDYLPKPFREK
jgi:hypothetical protein